jgi:hypothetical protein
MNDSANYQPGNMQGNNDDPFIQESPATEQVGPEASESRPASAFNDGMRDGLTGIDSYNPGTNNFAEYAEEYRLGLNSGRSYRNLGYTLEDFPDLQPNSGVTEYNTVDEGGNTASNKYDSNDSANYNPGNDQGDQGDNDDPNNTDNGNIY